ncbi:MAG: hypothetical protein H7174_09935 [Flavobacterium sp.]|nr:hypothetical protein [Flavobacterium sp.]
MVILLDIDGVMVPAKSWKKPEFLNDGFPAFSAIATISLNKILTRTNADILLTTSHKSNYNLEIWQKMFANREINVGNIYALVENTNHLSRKEEIMNWVNSSSILKDFIIIDDDKTLNSLPEFVKSRLIQTNATIGLTNELADFALEIIQKEKTHLHS